MPALIETDAYIPDSTTLELLVEEDADGDGHPENSAIITVSDGVLSHSVNEIDFSRTSTYRVTPTGATPVSDGWELQSVSITAPESTGTVGKTASVAATTAASLSSRASTLTVSPSMAAASAAGSGATSAITTVASLTTATATPTTVSFDTAVKYRLKVSATVPDSTTLELLVEEDIDGDGFPENSATVVVRDGTHEYTPKRLDISEGNQYRFTPQATSSVTDGWILHSASLVPPESLTLQTAESTPSAPAPDSGGDTSSSVTAQGSPTLATATPIGATATYTVATTPLQESTTATPLTPTATYDYIARPPRSSATATPQTPTTSLTLRPSTSTSTASGRTSDPVTESTASSAISEVSVSPIESNTGLNTTGILATGIVSPSTSSGVTNTNDESAAANAAATPSAGTTRLDIHVGSTTATGTSIDVSPDILRAGKADNASVVATPTTSTANTYTRGGAIVDKASVQSTDATSDLTAIADTRNSIAVAINTDPFTESRGGVRGYADATPELADAYTTTSAVTDATGNATTPKKTTTNKITFSFEPTTATASPLEVNPETTVGRDGAGPTGRTYLATASPIELDPVSVTHTEDTTRNAIALPTEAVGVNSTSAVGLDARATGTPTTTDPVTLTTDGGTVIPASTTTAGARTALVASPSVDSAVASPIGTTPRTATVDGSHMAAVASPLTVDPDTVTNVETAGGRTSATTATLDATTQLVAASTADSCSATPISPSIKLTTPALVPEATATPTPTALDPRTSTTTGRAVLSASATPHHATTDLVAVAGRMQATTIARQPIIRLDATGYLNQARATTALAIAPVITANPPSEGAVATSVTAGAYTRAITDPQVTAVYTFDTVTDPFTKALTLEAITLAYGSPLTPTLELDIVSGVTNSVASGVITDPWTTASAGELAVAEFRPLKPALLLTSVSDVADATVTPRYPYSSRSTTASLSTYLAYRDFTDDARVLYIGDVEETPRVRTYSAESKVATADVVVSESSRDAEIDDTDE